MLALRFFFSCFVLFVLLLCLTVPVCYCDNFFGEEGGGELIALVILGL